MFSPLNSTSESLCGLVKLAPVTVGSTEANFMDAKFYDCEQCALFCVELTVPLEMNDAVLLRSLCCMLYDSSPAVREDGEGWREDSLYY